MKDGDLTIKSTLFTENVAVKVSQIQCNLSVLSKLKANISVLDLSIAALVAIACCQSGGALFFDTVRGVLIDASTFLENSSNSAGLALGGGGAIDSFLGDITLRNTMFSGNTGSNGFDILIEDDNDPVVQLGSFVYCAEQVIFCNGLNGTQELLFTDANRFVNTNCPELGVVGSPGDGVCPL